MKLTLTAREQADVMRRRASKGRRKLSGPKLETRRAKPKHGRVRDLDYLSWLHDGLDCIACLILGRGPRDHAGIEAAHQKVQDAARGLHRKLGVRPDDWQTVPLCAWHHTVGPVCCDPAQGKFWALLNVDPGALCADLYAAFRGGLSGMDVIRRHAAGARA